MFRAFLIYSLKCPSANTTQSYEPNEDFVLKLKSNFLLKESSLFECCFCNGNRGFNFTYKAYEQDQDGTSSVLILLASCQ